MSSPTSPLWLWKNTCFKKAELASYIVFDIPCIDGKSIMDKPLSDRKNILKDKLKERIASRLLNPFPKTKRLITAPPSRWA
jgi:ATP-dependent DNA ligase